MRLSVSYDSLEQMIRVILCKDFVKDTIVLTATFISAEHNSSEHERDLYDEEDLRFQEPNPVRSLVGTR